MFLDLWILPSDGDLVSGLGDLFSNHRGIVSNAISRSPGGEAVVECTRCTIWLYVNRLGYVETTCMFLRDTFGLSPVGATWYT